MATSTKDLPAKKPPIKLPKNLGACADLYYEALEKRLAADKVAAALKATEVYIAEHLIQSLPKGEATGVSGKRCSVRIENKEDYRPKDWDKVWAYIFKQKDPTLLQRRLSVEAIRDIMSTRKTPLPGIEKVQYPVVRYSVIK